MRIEATAAEIRALLLFAGSGPGAGEAGSSPRPAAARGIPPRLRERCQELVDAGRVPALVAIERGACSGCHVRLPTMVEWRARRSAAIHTCPRCRRMLYAPELLATDTRTDDPSPVPGRAAGRGRS
jgi:hypothetical protein